MDNLVKFKRDAEWIIRTSKACPSAAKGLPKARRTSPHECFAFRTYGSIRTHPQSIKKATRWVAFFIDALSGLFVRTGTRIYALMNLRFARFRTLPLPAGRRAVLIRNTLNAKSTTRVLLLRGAERIRTAVKGFADLCLATRPQRQNLWL